MLFFFLKQVKLSASLQGYTPFLVNLYKKKRNHLLLKTGEKLLFLYHNLRKPEQFVCSSRIYRLMSAKILICSFIWFSIFKQLLKFMFYFFFYLLKFSLLNVNTFKRFLMFRVNSVQKLSQHTNYNFLIVSLKCSLVSFHEIFLFFLATRI